MTESATYVCKLPAEDKEFAATFLNENDDTRSEAIEEIRKWISECDDLRARTDDFFILRFLRGCKFNREKTKKKIRNFHELKAKSPQWFSNRDPFLPELQEMFEMGVFLPLRKLDNEGRMVVLIRTTVHDPAKHKQADVFKAGKMILDIATRENESVSLRGIMAIFDLRDVTLGHALQLPPHVIKQAVHSWQGCYPTRIISMDFVNAPFYVNFVLNVFKKFMSSKLQSRVHVHYYGMRGLLKKVPADILPVEYGGTDGTIHDLKEYWKKEVEENRQWFVDDENYKVLLKDVD